MNKIRFHILQFFNEHKGETFYGRSISKYVQSQDILLRYKYDDTIRREMRKCRLEGLIDYQTISTKRSLYKIIK